MEKGKIKIRKFQVEDIPKKVSIINDSNNNKYLHYDLPLEEDKTKLWFNKVKDSVNRVDLTILYDNEIVGFIGLLNVDEKNKKAEYYICVDSHYSGQGIGKTSTELLLQYAFSDIKLNKVYLYTEEDNQKAQFLFEKVGFKKEGFLKDDIYYNERFVSRYVYGIWKEDIK